MEKPPSHNIKLESFKLPRSLFSRLEVPMVLMEFFVSDRGKWEWYYSSPSERPPNTE